MAKRTAKVSDPMGAAGPLSDHAPLRTSYDQIVREMYQASAGIVPWVQPLQHLADVSDALLHSAERFQLTFFDDRRPERHQRYRTQYINNVGEISGLFNSGVRGPCGTPLSTGRVHRNALG